jgi:hypothetical protein
VAEDTFLRRELLGVERSYQLQFLMRFLFDHGPLLPF